MVAQPLRWYSQPTPPPPPCARRANRTGPRLLISRGLLPAVARLAHRPANVFQPTPDEHALFGKLRQFVLGLEDCGTKPGKFRCRLRRAGFIESRAGAAICPRCRQMARDQGEHALIELGETRCGILPAVGELNDSSAGIGCF